VRHTTWARNQPTRRDQRGPHVPGTVGVPGRSAAPDGDVPVSEELARAAGLALERALARPGRIRESAFDLLAADALFTWACEAALEEDEPEERLHRILEETLGR